MIRFVAIGLTSISDDRCLMMEERTVDGSDCFDRRKPKFGVRRI
jgi:hypothetical protein